MVHPLMPKATAVWLIDNTTLTFEQIAEHWDQYVGAFTMTHGRAPVLYDLYCGEGGYSRGARASGCARQLITWRQIGRSSLTP